MLCKSSLQCYGKRKEKRKKKKKAELCINGFACCATLAYTYYKYIAVAYLIQIFTNIIYMYMLTVYAVTDVLCRPPCF